MKFLSLIIPLLFVAYAKSEHDDVNQIQKTLWSNVEQQLEKLTDELSLLKSKLNDLLEEKGLSLSEISTLSDDDVHDIIGVIKANLELHCGDYSKIETYHEASRYKPLMRMADNLTEMCSPNNISYRFFSIDGSMFRFKLRASNDGHIALSRDNVGTQPIYEVIIGGWKNTKSVIRYNAKNDITSYNGAPLQECEYVDFWIRWESGFIQLGYEGDKKPFMSYNATNFYKVNYIGIHTGWGSTGSWIF